MPFVLPSDVEALQAQVRSQRDQLAASLNACHCDDPTVGVQWQAQSLAVDAFLAEDPSLFHTAAQMDQGQALQRDLGQWPARISACGCKDVPPSPAPPAPSGVEQATSLLATGIEAALVLGGLYMVIQLTRRR